MKKINIFLMLLLCLPLALQAQEFVPVAIDETNFPDANFKAVVQTFDTVDDDFLSEEEIAAVTTINVASKSITDMTGLKYFTEVETLFCYKNSGLTTLIVSENKKLKNLQCYECALTSLDVSQNTLLERLSCYKNKISSLDVSQNSNLKFLYCYENKELTTLDVTRNTNLTTLYCYSCGLTSLNVSGLSKLSSLHCYKNVLTTLNLSSNIALQSLQCNGNNISSLILPEEQPTSSANKLETLIITNNPVGSVDVSYFRKLKSLKCDYCNLNELDVRYNTNLETLDCHGNNISELNLTNNANITYLTCNNNKLKELDVTNLTKLATLICRNNELEVLDLTNCLELKNLECNSNHLTTLDLSKNTKCYKAQIGGQAKQVDITAVNFEGIGVEVLPSSDNSVVNLLQFSNVSGPGVNTNELDYQVMNGKHYLVISKPTADVEIEPGDEKITYSYAVPYSSTQISNPTLKVTLTPYFPYVMYVNPASKGLSSSFYSGTIILDYDAVVPEGMEVYVANEVKTAADGSQSLGMKSVGLPGDVIPANTPLYVRATESAGLYAFARNLSEATPVSIPDGNLLQGTLTNKPVSPNAYLTLGIQTELEDETYGEVGFWPFIGTQISAHRCFVDASLVNSGNTTNGLSFSFSDDTNQVESLPVSGTASTVTTWFNLQGGRLSGKPSHKGIYICNGKKVIIK